MLARVGMTLQFTCLEALAVVVANTGVQQRLLLTAFSAD